MATVDELQKRVFDLQKKLSETKQFTTSTSRQRVSVPVMRGNRVDYYKPSTISSQSVQENPEYQKILSDYFAANQELNSAVTSREGTYNTLAEQIRALGGTGGMGSQVGQPQAMNQALAALGGDQNFGASDLATRLNFQVSDEQILNDYNQAKLGRLNQLVGQGNAQIAGITERLNTAQNLLNSLPSGDPRRTASEVTVNQLKSDLTSVQSGVADATNQIQNFKPLAPGSEEALKQIVSFREYIQLPEERATQQLRQIDPNTYRTAVGLGQRYRQMAMEPLPETTTEPTEQLRQTIEQEALNQLRLGSTIGAEERRGYEQAVRAAQTARGNIFGLGPAVQEAATLGAAGEQRKLARFGAAQQFLASGETTGAAQARDLALRDALTQQRLGAAAGFIAGGPSIANLAQARTAQQQGAFQNYIQATQPLPGQFGQAPSTAQPFFQVAQQEIPVQLTNAFTNLYGAQADYLSSTYGAQVGAISRQPSGAQIFGDIAGGLSNLIKI
jgi:phosphotransferase system IIB component